MKKRILFILFITLSITVVAAQNTKGKNDPTGEWKFEAPSAPEGYTSGSILISFAEKKYTAAMFFAGNAYKYTGEKVKFENDSLFFSVYVEGQDVSVNLKISNPSMMSGKAVYSQGEVPLTLSKLPVKAEQASKK
jgi:hypothetical protein